MKCNDCGCFVEADLSIGIYQCYNPDCQAWWEMEEEE